VEAGLMKELLPKQKLDRLKERYLHRNWNDEKLIVHVEYG